MSPDHDGKKVVLNDEDAKRAFQERMAITAAGVAPTGPGQGPGPMTAAPSPNSMNPSQPNMAGGVQ
jgi:hypothetical protein